MDTKYQWYSSVEEVTHFGGVIIPFKIFSHGILRFFVGPPTENLQQRGHMLLWMKGSRCGAACHCYGVKAIFLTQMCEIFPASRWCDVGFLHWKPSTKKTSFHWKWGRSFIFQVFWPLGTDPNCNLHGIHPKSTSSGNRFLRLLQVSMDEAESQPVFGCGGSTLARLGKIMGDFQQTSPGWMPETYDLLCLPYHFCVFFTVKLHVMLPNPRRLKQLDEKVAATQLDDSSEGGRKGRWGEFDSIFPISEEI